MSTLKQEVYEALYEELKRLADRIEREMKEACPVESGKLRNSIHQEWHGKKEVFIGSDLPQMYYTNYGNAPARGGKIRPKRGKYMWFQSEKDYNLEMVGSYYRAESVNPYKGTHWVEKIAAKYK